MQKLFVCLTLLLSFSAVAMESEEFLASEGAPTDDASARKFVGLFIQQVEENGIARQELSKKVEKLEGEVAVVKTEKITALEGRIQTLETSLQQKPTLTHRIAKPLLQGVGFGIAVVAGSWLIKNSNFGEQ